MDTPIYPYQSTVCLPVYQGYTKFAIWQAPHLAQSYYGLLSNKSPVLNPVASGEQVVLPFFYGHLYVAYQPEDDLKGVTFKLYPERPESLVYHIYVNEVGKLERCLVDSIGSVPGDEIRTCCHQSFSSIHFGLSGDNSKIKLNDQSEVPLPSGQELGIASYDRQSRAKDHLNNTEARLHAFLKKFPAPPLHKLVTRPLESETKYNDSEWQESTWEENLSSIKARNSGSNNADFKAKVAMPMGSKKSLDQSNGPADKTKGVQFLSTNTRLSAKNAKGDEDIMQPTQSEPREKSSAESSNILSPPGHGHELGLCKVDNKPKDENYASIPTIPSPLGQECLDREEKWKTPKSKMKIKSSLKSDVVKHIEISNKFSVLDINEVAAFKKTLLSSHEKLVKCQNRSQTIPNLKPARKKSKTATRFKASKDGTETRPKALKRSEDFHIKLNNRFSVLETLKETEIEAYLCDTKPQQKPSCKKKCRKCTFRKNCHSNFLDCKANGNLCFYCNKPNHFPQSKDCTKRKEKFKLRERRPVYGCLRLREFLKIKSHNMKNSIVLDSKLSQGCNGCNKSHFKNEKFCKWWRKKHFRVELDQKFTSITLITEEEKEAVKKHISRIENESLIKKAVSEKPFIEKAFLLLYLLSILETVAVSAEETIRKFAAEDLFVENSVNLIKGNERKEALDRISHEDTKVEGNIQEDTLDTLCKRFLRKTCETASLPDIIFDNVCPKLKGGAPNRGKVKNFKAEEEELNLLACLNLLRSSNMCEQFKDHKKCAIKTSCNFCLLRSIIYKVNQEKGRQSFIPVEIQCQTFTNLKDKSIIEVLEAVLDNVSESLLDFEAAVFAKWHCSCCQQTVLKESGKFIELNDNLEIRNIQNLLERKYKFLLEAHTKEALAEMVLHDEIFEIKLKKEQKTCIFYSSSAMEVDLKEVVNFGGISWRCVSAITDANETFFKNKNDWYKWKCTSQEIEECEESFLKNVSFAIYDNIDIENSCLNEKFCYVGKDLKYLHNKKDTRKKDRHLPTETRKEHDATDRHRPTETRKEDRHRPTETRKGDRHKPTPTRKESVKLSMRKCRENNKLRLKAQELLSDTGMDLICCSCVEWKSVNSCVRANKLPAEKLSKFCTEADLTRNSDGNFYICNTCKLSIAKDIEPRRCQKEILGLLNFPNELMEDLELCCTPWNKKEREDPQKRYLQLNRVEDYLLKPVIPFIRIGHLPRGRYFQLKGDLIMVSANVAESLNKILPVEQNLVPVALKRKVEYSGHLCQEYCDRNKLRVYFQWFQRHNHLFKDLQLDENLIGKFENEAQKIVEKADLENDDILKDHDEITKLKETIEEIYESDEEEDEEITVKLKKDHVTCDHSSVITNKYVEDIRAPTIANKFSDMILSFEHASSLEDVVEPFNPDPEEGFYVEDELLIVSDNDDEDEFIENETYSEEDIKQHNLMKKIKMESRQTVQWIRTNLSGLCKCGIIRKVSLVEDFKFQLELLKIEHEKLDDFRKELLNEFSDCIKVCREALKNLPENCHHKTNNLSSDIINVIEDNEENSEKTMKYVEKLTRKIKDNAKKLSIAPSEEGKWVNWYSDLYLEEKLFPKLFPYGVGGYLSSNMLKNSNMGYSNYIKNRLLSADPKFRQDQSYTFFLLLVKELTDMKRSEQTYLRKATKVPNLNAKQVNDITKEHLFRYNNAYSSFKTIRGTSMYYQDTKKKLMATLRQKGAPTLFTTFSCAEFEWDTLVKSIYETENKKKVSNSFIKEQSVAWKNKLVSENVTQSTLHFAKRTDKLMSILNTGGMFTHNSKEFKADSYFYRVEFQARGAPHIHCLLWLEDEDGNKPPSMWNENKIAEDKLNQEIADFGQSVMCGSATEMNCDNHAEFDKFCADCSAGKELVEKFQNHKHTFSCKKKGRVIRILSTEGHGRLDRKVEGDELLVPVCRLRHPKYPIDKTEFVRAFPQDVDENELKEAKKDYQKIRKYLLRLTNGDDFKQSDEWKNFKNLTFNQFLFHVGMFNDEKFTEAEDKIAQARKRYLTALRCEVRSSGLLVLKRGPADILTNNFNKKLIKLHAANQDIQYITDEYAVAEYICNYITKNESGLSSLLKNINDEAIEQGEETLKTIKKLRKALDKGREMSIQEAIYRSLGLSMTKFNDIVRFINTAHPDRRDGLLKSNMNELVDGENIFHNSLHDYYQIRPEEKEGDETKWNDMCLSDFVADYNIAYKSSSRNDSKVIKLSDNKSFITKRNRKCVIRYFLKYDNEDEYYRALCTLFLPFRNEKLDIHTRDVKELYKTHEEQIEKNRSKYEKHKTMIDMIENFEKEKENENDDIEEEEDPQYVDDETTTEKEMEDFEKSLKDQAKKMIANYSAGSKLMNEDDYLEMIGKLNPEQRVIFDDYVERINLDREENPFYLYIGGEAGTGKSFVLKAMINAAKKRGKRSGGDLDKPVCLTLAPTGVAAYLVNGTTIESGLGLQPTRDRAYQRNPASRNSSLRFLYEDLQVIFLDEVSMCGSDMLAKMNFRMQEIMGNSKFMGGVSLVCTGDFGQLPPVGQRMVWETSYLDNRIDIAPNHWNDNFRIFYLTQKMRSQDEEFSTICDQVRKGICDDKEVEYLVQHIGRCPSEDDNTKYAGGKFSIIVTTNLAREAINNDKLEKLLPGKKLYYATAIDKSTNNPQAPEVSDKLPVTRTGQLQKKIVFKEGAPVMITSNHQKSKYKNNGLVNGARGYIDSIQASKDDPDVAEIVWVRFNDDKIGQLLRSDSRALLNQHTPKDQKAVPIRRQKKQFQGKGNTEYMRDQFPLTLCYAVTAHKSQGQTLDEVLIDFSGESRINNGSFYTAISRVKYGKNLYLKDFKPEYIKANPDVEKKMEAMKIFRSYNFKKVYNTESIFSGDDELKIGYININDILTAKSLHFLNEDRNLLALDFLTISDTRLNDQIDDAYLREKLSNWEIEERFDTADSMKHMGMLMLKSKNREMVNVSVKVKHYPSKNCDQMQVMFASYPEFDLKSSCVYVRETPTKDQIDVLKKDLKDVDLVMGDLNLDQNRSNDSEKLQSLCSVRTKVLNEITTTRYNQLDHILLNIKRFQVYFSTSFINHTSDHHVITARIPKVGNKFKDSFLEKITFNVDFETGQTKGNVKEKERKPYENVPKFEVKSEKQDIKREPSKASEQTQEINLACLFSPNWLNDEVIDNYLKLLNTKNDTVFMYTTYFHQAFEQYGFKKVENYYRKHDLLSYKLIFIPVHHGNHWFLITFNGTELVSFDPYNYPGATQDRRSDFLKENLQFHINILANLRDNYFKPLFNKKKKQFKGLSLNVKLPPTIPAQNNGYDCGVFLLAFAKYLVFNMNFDFCTDDMINIRNRIMDELKTREIFNFDVSNKREQSSPKEIPYKRMKRSQECEQRRIFNPDAETCWLNSCIQLVLTALDYKYDLKETGSVLWDHLIWMKGKDPSVVLDPTDLKDVIVQTERERIITGNLAPNHLLFDLGNLPISVRNDREVSCQRIGQQDCKDFFFCLDENRKKWSDVFNLFKVNTLSMTECTSCNNVSSQEVSGNERSFISLDCPSQAVSMKTFIEEKMNGYELIQDWRDEDGCNEKTAGKTSTRLSNVEDAEYIIFLIERLIQIEGNLEIKRTKVKVEKTEEITLTDNNGRSAKFFPIAIIHHSGNVIGETTSGHYRADVKNYNTNKWYRTSDNDPPEDLSRKGLTQMGYIFLYKKSRIDQTRVFKPEFDAVKSSETVLFSQIVSFLDEMNIDLVFTDFDNLAFVESQWISKITSQEFNISQISTIVDKLGKRMICYSNRVSIQVIFLLTDWLHQTSLTNKSNLAGLLINENILDAMRVLLSTTCHLTIRSVLNLVYYIACNIPEGFGKMTLLIKLSDKITWVAEKKHPMNYLSSPAISKDDQVIQRNLHTKQADFTLNGTHELAKEIITLLK